MERRILKDFHIGSIENALEHFCTPKGPQDVFTQLAKAIKLKKSVKRQSKEWNVAVKQHGLDRDPIGSTKVLEKTVQNRKSLRKSLKGAKSQSSDDLLGKYICYVRNNNSDAVLSIYIYGLSTDSCEKTYVTLSVRISRDCYLSTITFFTSCF